MLKNIPMLNNILLNQYPLTSMTIHVQSSDPLKSMTIHVQQLELELELKILENWICNN